MKPTIDEIIHKARIAQKLFEQFNQQQVDEVVTAVAWAICKPQNNQKISEFAVSSTGLGKIEDKITKNRRKTLGLLRDLKGITTVGVISENKKKGYYRNFQTSWSRWCNYSIYQSSGNAH